MAIMNPYNYSKPRSFIKIEGDAEAERSNNNPVNTVNTVQARNMPSDKANQYLENRIMAARPEELTYMLYEGLVKFIKKAIMYLSDGNMPEVNYNAQRAQAILDELRATLNKEVPLSQSLEQLYEYMSFKLVEANIEKSTKSFAEALEMAESFKETWRQAFDLKA